MRAYFKAGRKKFVKIQKILIVSKFSEDPNVYTYATSFARGLNTLGYDVKTFNCKRNFLGLKSMLGVQHDGLPFALKKINTFFVNRDLVKHIRDNTYDLVFFVKAENIAYKTIRKIKQVGQIQNMLDGVEIEPGKTCENTSLLVNFYPDNPFVFWNGNSNKDILRSLPEYDCFLSWSKMLMPALFSAGAQDVYYFPFAYDEEIFGQKQHIFSESQQSKNRECEQNYICEQDKKKYSSSVCFIGTWDKEREIWLTKLCERMPDLDLAIWGNRWHDMLDKKSVSRKKLRGRAIYAHDMIKAFTSSKIVLNFIRTQNMTSHNMRTWEVLASNVFLLTQRTDEQTSKPFEEKKNIECFEDLDELAKKIAFYLKTDILRKKIAHRGFMMSQEYGITQQISKFIRYLESNLERKKSVSESR